MSWDLDTEDIESGKFHCPKCSFDAIYDEKSRYLDGEKKPNVGFRNLFIKWIYRYDRDKDYKFNNNIIIEGYWNSGIISWLVRYRNIREEQGYDEYIKKRESGDKEFQEDDRKQSKYCFSWNFMESEIEERFVCFKC